MKLKHFLFLVCVILPISGKAAEIIGVAWPTGVYRIDSVTAQDVFVGEPGYTGINALARDRAGTFYTTDQSTNLIVINPSTGIGTAVTTLKFTNDNVNLPALAFSSGNVLYGINREFPDALYTIDVATGIATFVGSLGGGNIVQGLAFSPGGTLYGWDINNGLVTINIATGAATDVNPSVGASSEIQCLAFAPDGTLYGARAGLFTINTTTGEPTLISDPNAFLDIRGMEFNTPPALYLTADRIASGMRLCCQTLSNVTYQLQHKGSLDPLSQWTNTGSQFVGNGGLVCFTNPTAAPSQFYRASVVQ